MKYFSKLLTALSGEQMEGEGSELLFASLVITVTLLVLSINL
jgi:hypothetical protein